MIAISPEAGAAMASQVRRVNKKSVADLVSELEQAHITIERLRDQLRRVQAQRQDPSLFDIEDTAEWQGETLAGKPVLTLRQAAARLPGSKNSAAKYQAAYRRVVSGKWRAVKLPSGDWRVFADQPLC